MLQQISNTPSSKVLSSDPAAATLQGQKEVQTPVVHAKPYIKLAQLPTSEIDEDLERHHKLKSRGTMNGNQRHLITIANQMVYRSSGFS